MRIRIVQTPRVPCIDGVRLDLFRQGFCYEVGTTLATLLLAERWAEPVADGKPALLTPLDELTADAVKVRTPPNLHHRETYPPSVELALAADASSRTRGRRRNT